MHDEGKCVGKTLFRRQRANFQLYRRLLRPGDCWRPSCSRCANTANKWPRSLSASLRARGRATSRCRLLDLERPSSTGGNCSVREISESRLPPGGAIRFREPTGWERYSVQSVLIFGALLFQAARDRFPDLRASASTSCGDSIAQCHIRVDLYESKGRGGRIVSDYRS